MSCHYFKCLKKEWVKVLKGSIQEKEKKNQIKKAFKICFVEERENNFATVATFLNKKK
jgi:hypothetical protein